MPRFSAKLILFLLPVVAIVFFLEYKLSLTPNSYKIKRKYFEEQLDSIKVMVLGSSETQSDVLPGYFSYRGFNLANVAQPLYYDKELVLSYMDRMPHLRMVIISLNYTSFYYELADTREYWREYYYYRFWGISNSELPFIDIKKVSLIALYSWPEVRKIINNGFGNDYTRGDKKIGYNGGLDIANLPSGGPIKDTGSLAKDARFTIAFIGKSLKEKRFDSNYAYINTLVDSLSRKKIKVVLISAPVSKEMYGYMNDSTYINSGINIKTQKAISTICQKYGCRYYNFTNDDRFNSADFSNSSHLNSLGAIKFSKILNDEVVVPGY